MKPLIKKLPKKAFVLFVKARGHYPLFKRTLNITRAIINAIKYTK